MPKSAKLRRGPRPGIFLGILVGLSGAVAGCGFAAVHGPARPSPALSSRRAETAPAPSPPSLSPLSAASPGASPIAAWKALHMASATRGWAWSATGHLLWTQDGGTIWHSAQGVAAVPTSALAHGRAWSGIWPSHPTTGWFATVLPASRTLWVGVTTDAGQRWTVQATRLPSARFGQLINTVVNRASGWTLMAHPPTPGPADIWSVRAPSPVWRRIAQTTRLRHATALQLAANGHGWATGFLPMAHTSPLWRTTNSGRTWHATALPLPPAERRRQLLLGAPTLTASAWIIPAVWMGSAAAVHAVFLRPFGGSWQVASGIPAPVGTGAPMAWVGTQDGWVGGSPAQTLWHTSDAGQQWHRDPTPFSSLAVQGLDFVTAQTGWAWGVVAHRDVQLWSTHDGGTTWSRLAIQVPAPSR